MGIFRSTRGQFGIKTVSKCYEKAMYLSVGWLKKHGVFSYADDIVIYGKDFSHCLWALEKVLDCLKRDGFVVSARKCHFFKKTLEVLG